MRDGETMMRCWKKILPCLFVILMVVGVFSSCSSVGRIKSTAEEAKVVGTCAGYEVRYEELRYLVMKHKEELISQYGDGIFDTEEGGEQYEEELKKLVNASLCQSYAILDLCEKEKIRTSDKVTKKEVQEEVDAAASVLGGTKEYKAYLDENYMTDAVYRLYTAIVSCQSRYYDVLAQNMQKEAYDAVFAQDGFVRTMSIFVRNDPGESKSENRAAAEYVRDRIREGKSIESFIGTKYNQDTSNCDYYFPRGYMDEAYENAAFALEIGEVSDVVEVTDGFYVMVRLAPEDGYFQNNLETLMQKYIVGKMNIAFADRAGELTFEPNEYGKTLVFHSMK